MKLTVAGLTEHPPASSRYELLDLSKLTGRAVRIALDYTTPRGQARRRTGTVLFRGQQQDGDSMETSAPVGAPGPMGWSIHWDCECWFAGARVGLSFPPDTDLRRRETDALSAVGEVEDEEPASRFAFLVWMWEVELRIPELSRTQEESAAEWGIFPMVCKRQQGWAPVELTSEEKSMFSAGRSM